MFHLQCRSLARRLRDPQDHQFAFTTTCIHKFGFITENLPHWLKDMLLLLGGEGGTVHRGDRSKSGNLVIIMEFAYPDQKPKLQGR